MDSTNILLFVCIASSCECDVLRNVAELDGAPIEVERAPLAAAVHTPADIMVCGDDTDTDTDRLVPTTADCRSLGSDDEGPERGLAAAATGVTRSLHHQSSPGPVRHERPTNTSLNKKTQFSELIAQYYKTEHTKKDTWITETKRAYVGGDALWPALSWGNDTSQFYDVCRNLDAFLQATNSPESVYYKSYALWGIIKDSIDTVQRKLQYPPTNFRVPFGTNWFSFSISFPRLVTAAVFLHERQFNVVDGRLFDIMREVVTNYLPSPVRSMGWRRSGPNVVMMSVPYFGAHILLGDYDAVLSTPDVQLARQTVRVQTVTRGEGLYPDGGYWFHAADGRGTRAYGYITATMSDYELLGTLLDDGSDASSLFDKIFEKTEHPTIPVHFGPWFKRDSYIGASVRSDRGKLGFYKLDSISGVSCKTARWLLAFNGQHPDLCAYEPDPSNFVWAQFWVFSRMMMYKSTKNKLQAKLIPYYPGVVSFDHEVVALPSRTRGTDQYFADNAKTSIVQHENILGFYTSFAFVNLNLKVWEIIIVDSKSDGYYCLQKIEPIDEHAVQGKPIFKSVNLGTSASPEPSAAAGAVYRFPNDYSHVFRGTPELQEVVGSDGVTYLSLQLTPDSDNYVFYATLGNSTSAVLSHDPELKQIELFDCKLQYDEERDWLVLSKGSVATVGVTSPAMLETVHLDHAGVTALLGTNIKPINGTETYLPTREFTFSANYRSLSVDFWVGI